MDPTRSPDINYISEFVNNFLDHGTLSLSLQRQFWSNLNDIETSTCYFTVLITKVIGIDIGDKTSSLYDLVRKILMENNSMEPAPTNSKFVTEEQLNIQVLKNSLLNTLYFLALYYRFNPEFPFLRVALSKWSQITLLERSRVDSSDRSRVDFSDEIIRMLSTSGSESTNDIIRLVDQCSNIDYTPSYDFINERIDAKTTVSSLLNNFLRTQLYKEQTSKLILETILLFLKHPLLSEKRMLSLLHVFKQYLIQSPKVPFELLQNAISVVKSYYLWPLPFGDVARDVLQMLTIEMKAPGTAMRKRMTEENPELLKGTHKTGKERTVHVLYDQYSLNARTLPELIKSQPTTDTNLQQLQTNLLANILSNELKCGIDAFGLEHLSKEEIARFYDAAVQVMSEAVLMNQQDAEAFRSKEFVTIKDEVSAAVEASQKMSAPKPNPPILPPLSFEFTAVSSENYPPFGDELQNKVKYPKRPSFDILATIIGKYAPFSDAKNKPVVKIGLIGGDALIHNVFCSYINLKTVAPKSFDGLDLQFFVVPVEQCYFSGFLSKYDGWYGRHVTCLSKCLLKVYPCVMLPQISQSQSSSSLTSALSLEKDKPDFPGDRNSKIDARIGNGTKSQRYRVPTEAPTGSFFQDLRKMYEDEDRLTTPSLVLRSELQNYFREAKWRLEANVYNCECWAPDGTYFVVPFFQRAEVGLRAYARSVQRQFEMADSLPLSAVQQHKSFKFSAPPIGIKYTQMNVVGVPKTGTPIEPRYYCSIILANVPLPSDRGVPPNPTKQWLETSLMEIDKKKKGKASDKDYENLPIISLHTSVIDLEAEEKKKDKSFHILLDNVLYGPFVRVKVTPAMSNEDNLSVPFMTFFPLELPS
eukprot:TRINITY_DN2400_c0_g1_i3.p1 TRINITY_DN2400_c0_g1~~TRINITY_DN2400_c0_g1_i3.p1  ORF type:complete len:869 (+),score=260.87 TRINITY_DN2400_c0_g1_i3:249-2855(+)